MRVGSTIAPGSATLRGGSVDRRVLSLVRVARTPVEPLASEQMGTTDSQPPPSLRAGTVTPARGPVPPPPDVDATDDAASAPTAPLGALPGGSNVLERGVSIGRYIVLDRLGEGGMGVVYKAYDPELDRPVALKLVRAMAGRSEARAAAQDRLLREARALARLSHPNVVAVHDVGAFRDDVFLAIEFVEGTTLRRWLREGSRSLAEIVGAFVAAGQGLAAAHSSGLVHRDFKPDNVIVGKDGRIRVLDFGLARRAEGADGERASGVSAELPAGTAPVDASNAPASSASGPTSSSVSEETPLSAASTLASRRLLSAPLTLVDGVLGTPRYMSPEQHLGEPTDARTDQFSFCVALYEALYGTSPFAGRTPAEMRATVLLGRVTGPPPSSKVPRWLRQVLLRGLARSPADRFPTMDALLAELRRDHTLARQRWARAAVALALVAAGFAGWHRTRKEQRTVCQGAAQRLEGVWDEAAKARVKAAFLASQRPYATDAWVRVERALDDYTARWTSLRTEACEATRLRGEQSEELLDLRMQCLDQRLGEVRTHVATFASGDRAVVETAARAAQSLGSLAACSDGAALRAPVPVPAAPSARADVTAARDRIARARALYEAAKYTDGAQAANEALELARRAAFRPAEADALLERGRVERGSSNFKAADATLREAWLAAEAGRHEETRARIWTELVWVHGEGLARYAEAHEWARAAESILEPLGQKDDLRGALLRNEAHVYFREGKYEQALDLAQRAVAVLERTLGPEHPDLGDTHNEMGHAYLYLVRYDDAFAQYQAAHGIWRRALGDRHPNVARALNNMGSVLSNRGRYDEARTYLEDALRIWEPAVGPGAPVLANPLNNLGIVHARRGEYDLGRQYYNRAIAILVANFGPNARQLMNAYHGLGELEFVTKHYDAADESFRKCLAVLEAAGGPDHPEVALPLNGLSKVAIERKQFGVARAYSERALRVAEKGFGANNPSVADALRRLGQIAILQHEPARAIPLLERALSIRSTTSDDDAVRADAMSYLARAQWDAGRDRAGARRLAEDAAAIFRRTAGASQLVLPELEHWLATHRLDGP